MRLARPMLSGRSLEGRGDPAPRGMAVALENIPGKQNPAYGQLGVFLYISKT
jgi:hypothetical protein